MTEAPPSPDQPVYLDNQATTRCDPRVVQAMLPYFSDAYGNPHSAEHTMGRMAEAAVESARAQVAALIGAEVREIIFTSGATEANNIAIKGAARFAAGMGDQRRRIVTVATEHKCVLESVADLAEEGFEPVVLPVRRDGLLDPETLREALRTPTLLVSVMAVNNETGVIQDIAGHTAIAKQAGALFHSDFAQAVGKIPVDVTGWRVDLASVSGHKIYGPKGIGALFVRRRPRVRLSPLFSGGGQERGLRSGTLPAPLIVGFGEACRLAAAEMAGEAERIGGLRATLLHRLGRDVPGLQINGNWQDRIAGNLNLTFPRASAVALMEAAPALCVSTGSACSSAAIEPSYVLRALGLSEQEAARTLRIAIGRFTSPADIDYAAAALSAAHAAFAAPATQPAGAATEARAADAARMARAADAARMARAADAATITETAGAAGTPAR
jgi:cysteine desulfurase